MTTLKTIGSGLFGLVLGGLLVWAHMSDLVELCQSQTSSVQAELQDMQREHQAMAEKLVQTQQERSAAYAELGRELGKKVDLTIPFKPIKVEQTLSYVPKDEAQGITELTEKFLASGMTWPAFKESVKRVGGKVLAGVRP